VSERRHRINGTELTGTEQGLRLYLQDQVRTRSDQFHAFETFKLYFRIINHVTGKPLYPKAITWEVVADYIGADTVPLTEVEEAATRIRFAKMEAA